jgi:hypothetical protein
MATNSNSQPALILTLESTGILLGSLVSLSILLGIAIKLITKLNLISSEIKALREDLNAHSDTEGHQQTIEQLRGIEKDFHTLDKRFDVHLQDYSGYKDIALLAINGNKELIAHKWIRTEEEFNKTNSEVKELQKYLQQQGTFRIRE